MLPKRIEKLLGLKRREKDDSLLRDLENLSRAVDNLKTALKHAAVDDWNRLKGLLGRLFGKRH